MAFQADLVAAAEKKLAALHQRAIAAAEQTRQRAYRKAPRLEEIDRQISQTGLYAARAVLGGKDAEEQIFRLQKEVQQLLKEKEQILFEIGLALSDLEPTFSCGICSDTGYVGGRRCQCLNRLIQEQAIAKLNEKSPLKLCTFGSFDLSFYSGQPDERAGVSPRKQMENVLKLCKSYAVGYTGRTDNLIFMGGTGLGKTHLSLAIAGELIQRNVGVLYTTVQDMTEAFEKQRFAKDGNENLTQLYFDCDLLVVDDLGTEFHSQFSVSALYSLINGRILSEKPTIINTNLNMEQLRKRYQEQIVSRIVGYYTPVMFLGSDIRQQKMLQNRQK